VRLKARFDLASVTGLVIVALVCAMSWIGASMMTSHVGSQQETWELLQRLDNVRDDVVDIETGTRGFVLTGDERFLEPYERGSRELAQDIARLRASAADDPEQRVREQELEEVIQQRVESSTRTVSDRRTNGFDAAASRVAHSEGKPLMDRVRVLMDEIESAGQARLDDNNAHVLGRSRLALWLIVGSTLAIGLLVLAMVMTFRRRVISPLAALAAAAARETGTWQGLGGDRTDEIGDLDHALADMVRRYAEAERRVAELIEDAPEAVLVSEGEVITQMNAAAEKLFGYTRSELLGQPTTILLPAEERRRVQEVRDATAKLSGVYVSEWTIQTKTGELVPIESTSKRLADGRRQAFYRDLRDRKRLEEERQASLAAREQLIAVVSHDLKNPLNAIELRSRLLDKAVVETRHRDHVASIRHSVEVMKRQIRGLLDSASLDAGHLRLAPTEHDLHQLVMEVFTVLAPVATDQTITLVSDVKPGTLRRYDPDRIAQVLFNLVGNALKFTPSGGTVTVSCEDVADGTAVTVRDTGAGIAPEAVSHIFERFYTSGGRTAGTGLGLDIVKGLVEAHGGTLSVASKVGDGSSFTFTIPGAPRTA
jgi:PAS domain S-box-containing protein